MTPEERLAALNRTIERCRNSQLYRERLPSGPLKSLDDIRGLPLTTKADLREASPYGLLCVPVKELCHYHETFGTTGSPVSNWLTRQDLEDSAREILAGALGFREDDIVLIRFPYAISSAAHAFHEAVRLGGACVIPASSRSIVSPFPRVINLMRKLGITVLAGLPLQALLLAETAEMLGLNPRGDFPMLRAICTAGESLSPARRDLLSGLWGVPLYNFYGLTELGNVAADCEHGRLHVAEDYFVVEVLSEDLKTEVEPGQMGVLVVTTLCREASPVIRYVTGDRARLVWRECPCGRSQHLEVRGRTQDLVTTCGRSFDVWDLEEILSHLPCRRFWVVAPTADGLHFVVEEQNPEDTVSPEARDRLEARHQMRLVFDIAPKGTLYDRHELLAIGKVGKPRYIYSEDELRRGVHENSART